MSKRIQYLIPAALIIDREHKILLIKKSSARTPFCVDRWEIPGGTTRFGESFEKALRRKIKEYLGIAIRIERIIPYIHSNVTSGTLDGKAVDMQFYVVGAVCTQVDEKQKITLKKDRIKDARWFRVGEIMKLPFSNIVPGDREIIKASGIC